MWCSAYVGIWHSSVSQSGCNMIYGHTSWGKKKTLEWAQTMIAATSLTLWYENQLFAVLLFLLWASLSAAYRFFFIFSTTSSLMPHVTVGLFPSHCHALCSKQILGRRERIFVWGEAVSGWRPMYRTVFLAQTESQECPSHREKHTIRSGLVCLHLVIHPDLFSLWLSYCPNWWNCVDQWDCLDMNEARPSPLWSVSQSCISRQRAPVSSSQVIPLTFSSATTGWSTCSSVRLC